MCYQMLIGSSLPNSCSCNRESGRVTSCYYDFESDTDYRSWSSPHALCFIQLIWRPEAVPKILAITRKTVPKEMHQAMQLYPNISITNTV